MAQNPKSGGLSHEKVETNNFLMIVLIFIVLLVGGMVEIVPLFFQKSTTEPVPGLKLTPLCRWSAVMCMCVKVATTAIRR